MSGEHDMPREATEQEIAALWPSFDELAQRVAQYILAECRMGFLPGASSPRVKLAFLLARAFEEDPILQEFEQNVLENDEALMIAQAILAALEKEL